LRCVQKTRRLAHAPGFHHGDEDLNVVQLDSLLNPIADLHLAAPIALLL
jgi:hypothetical protein